MRVPAAQVDLHHAHARLDQTPRDEKRLAPFLAAIQIADPIRFLAEIERVLAARTSGEQQAAALAARCAS